MKVADFPVIEFAQTLKTEVIALLVAYFDESGTHGSSKAACITGFVGKALEWTRIERPWRTLLNNVGVATFHASHCEMRRGEFEHLERPLRDSLVNGLVGEIEGSNIALVSGAILVEDWEKCAPDHLKKRFVSPYHFCFEVVLQKIHGISAKHLNGQCIALVFAEHQEYGRRAAWLHELYSNSGAFPYLGSFTTCKPSCLIPLQAADLAAYEVYQRLLAKRAANTNGPEIIRSLRPNMERISSKLIEPEDAQFHDCETIAKLKPDGKLDIPRD